MLRLTPATIARLAQGFNSLHQETRRQGWAVAIDEQDAVMSVEQEIARSAQQYIAEIVANLQLKPERCRKQLPHDVLDSRRRIDAIPAPAEGLRDRIDGCGDVTQKAGRELRGGNRANGRRKPRLCAARLRRLAYDPDRRDAHSRSRDRRRSAAIAINCSAS